MANAFGSILIPADPSRCAPEDHILSSEIERLTLTSNWLHARGVQVVQQCWNRREDLCRRAGGVLARMARWPIHPLGVRADVVPVVYAVHDAGGAGGTIRFKSVGSGNTVDIPLVAAAGPNWYVGGPLTCDFALGWDEIEMHVAGDGAAQTRVYTSSVEFPPLTSPLAAPASTDPVIPFDSAELDADEPASADTLRALRDNIDAMLARLAGYYPWSGLENSDAGAAATLAMPSWTHRLWAPVWPGSRQRAVTARVLVYARCTVAGQVVEIHHGGGLITGGSDSTVIQIDDVAVGNWYWYSADISLPEQRPIESVDTPLASLMIYPGTDRSMGMSTAEIASVGVWGL